MIVAGTDTVYSTGAYINPSTGIDPIVTVAYDAGSGARRWVGRYDGPEEGGEAYPWDSVLSPDGGTLYVAGSHTTAAPQRSTDAAVIAFDTGDGNIRWVASLGAEGSDAFRAVAVSPDGESVYAAGRLRGWPDADLLVAELDGATGAIRWTDTHAGSGGLDDEALDAALSPDGERLFVTGELDRRIDYQAQLERGDIITLAYDTEERTRLWTSVHDGPMGLRDEPANLAVSPDGRQVFVAGRQDADFYSGVYTEDIAVLAHDAATGARTWARSFDGPASSADEAEAVAVSPDGATVYVNGTMTVHEVVGPDRAMSLATSMVTLALGSSDGETTWSSVLDGPGQISEYGRDLAVSPDGRRVYATAISGPLWVASGVGNATLTDAPLDAATVAYDAADGSQVWIGRYNGGPGGSAPTRSSGMTLNPDGSRVFVLTTVNTPVLNPTRERRTAAYGTIAYES
jgi:hypothetical protein